MIRRHASSIVVLVAAIVVGSFAAFGQSPGGAPNPGIGDPARLNGIKIRTGTTFTLTDAQGNAGPVWTDNGTAISELGDGIIATTAATRLEITGTQTQLGGAKGNAGMERGGSGELQFYANSGTNWANITTSGSDKQLNLPNSTNLVVRDGTNALLTVSDSGSQGTILSGRFQASQDLYLSGATSTIIQNASSLIFEDASAGNDLAMIFDEGTTGSVGASSGRFRSFTESNTYLAVEESEDVIEAVINGVQEFQVTPSGIVATDLVTTPSLAFSGGASAFKAVKYSAAIDVANLVANACSINTISTADTADVEDDCFGNKPSALAALATTTTCYYDGSNVVLHVCNWSTISVDPGSATYTCTCNED